MVLPIPRTVHVLNRYLLLSPSNFNQYPFIFFYLTIFLQKAGLYKIYFEHFLAFSVSKWRISSKSNDFDSKMTVFDLKKAIFVIEIKIFVPFLTQTYYIFISK